MRITSIDKKVWLDISRNGDHVHSSFSVESLVDIGHGKFDAKNGDIHFLNFEEFVKNFDAFILNRKLTPQLNGPETEIKFSNMQNAVMVSFVIGDAFSGYSTTVRFKTEGAFEINAEHLNDLLSSFKKLFKNA
jgi:hypothetical protein